MTQSDTYPTGPLTDPPVLLPRAIHDEIIAHGRAGKPEEICGLLRGQGSRATELFRVENVAEDKVNNYTVDPKALLLQFQFEDEGDEMMGIYHTHPISVAYPSGTDAWSAHYPDSYYLICSLEFDSPEVDSPQEETGAVIRAFRMITRFLELDEAQLAELNRALPFDETRPGLFAYFQSPDAPIPPHLAALAGADAPPYYVVYGKDSAFGGMDVRLVTVREHAVNIV